MTTKRIDITTLMDFVLNKKKVDPWALTDAAEAFYRSVKVVGIDNTVVTYDLGSGEVECSGKEVSPYVLAFTGHTMRLIYRWDDLSSGRLEKHLGLDAPIQVILAETGVFKRAGVDLACTNVAEMINTWATVA